MTDKLREEYWNMHYPDPQEAKVYARCRYTGLEIYEGEEVIELPHGGYIRDDEEIIMGYFNLRRIVAGE